MNLNRFRTAFVLLCAAPFASADVVTMKDGRVLEGQVLEDDGKVVKIKLKKGAMTLDHKDIESVVEKPTPEEEYVARVAKLDANDAAAQLEIGRWAAGRELSEEAVRHLISAWKIDPELSGIAMELEKLDYHLMDGAWADADTYYPSIGYIKFDGRWCSPAEHAYRLAMKTVATSSAARDAAKNVLAANGGKVRKIEARADVERAALDKLAGLIEKAEKADSTALERSKATDARVKAAAEKLAAIQLKEKSKEGEEMKEPSQAFKAAEKALVTARAAAEKETKALSATRKVLTDHKAERTAAQGRLVAIEKEKVAAEDELAPLQEEVTKAQAEVDDATAEAAKLKAAWENSK